MTDTSDPKSTVPGMAERSFSLSDAFKQFHDWYRAFVEDESKQLDKGFEFNKQVWAFYERLLLIDIAIIGLTLSSLTALNSKLPALPSAKHIFAWFVVPGWVLLAFSSLCCWMVISHCVVSNRSLFEQWKTVTTNYNIQMVVLSVHKLAELVSGDPNRDTLSTTLTGHANRLSEAIIKGQKEDIENAVNKATGNEPYVKYGGRAAMISMQVGFVLLCIGGIKLFLAI